MSVHQRKLCKKLVQFIRPSLIFKERFKVTLGSFDGAMGIFKPWILHSRVMLSQFFSKTVEYFFSLTVEYFFSFTEDYFVA